MSEFITIQVGQCGNQIGHAFWPLLLQEHGLVEPCKSGFKKNYDDALHSFFYNPKNCQCHSVEDLINNKVKARAVLIDMENSVVERFHNSQLRDLFDRACTLSNYPGSGNNWAVGHYTHGGEQEDNITDIIRLASEKCDRLDGFLSVFSLGGGTGSGLGTAILRMLEDNYPKIDRIASCVHPGENNDVVTSPYNIAFSLHKLKNHATAVIPIDNQALLSICNRLKPTKDMVHWEPYRNMNVIIVKMLLHLTSGARFPGSLNFDMSDLSTNLVPFPGLHFLACSMSPITFVKENDAFLLKRQNELLINVCDKENQLSVNTSKGTVYSAALFGRGNISLNILRDYVNKFNSLVNYASWSNPGVKTSLCTVPALDHSKSLLCLANNSNMGTFFQRALTDFNRLYSKKAHVHHYTQVDGFEKIDFINTKEMLSETIGMYVNSTKEVNIPRFRVVL